MKLISILLALLNSLVAGLILALNLSGIELRESGLAWSIVKVCGALVVIAAGILTWRDGARPVRSNIMLAGSLALVAFGAAIAVWTIHLALVTGDMEAYMLVYGGSLMAQGAASVLGHLQEPSGPIPS